MTLHHENPHHDHRTMGGDLPSDLLAVDRLARRSLTVTDLPDGLVERVYAASRGLLVDAHVRTDGAHAASVLARVGFGRRERGVRTAASASPRVRWARVALAAAASIAVAAGTLLAVRGPVAPKAELEYVAAVPDAPANEALLVALLDSSSSPSTWVSDDTFGRNPFAQDVAPVLRSLDTDFVDVATELNAMFGSGVGTGL